MTKKTFHAALGGALLAAILVACDRPGGTEEIWRDFEQIPSASVAVAAAPAPVAAGEPAPASGAAATQGAPASTAAASGSSSASAAASGSAAVKVAKTYECGEKGKPDCPMQRWMKGVAGGAVASGDNDKLARAFNSIGAHPVSGLGAWSGICATGAAKAQAGDFDGSKAMCKSCHGKYQHSYHANMRDLKWP